MPIRFLEDRSFMRTMLRLALPLALQNLLITSFSLVDTLMVSRLEEDVLLAAIGFCANWSQLLTFLLFGIASGAAVFVSRYWGMKDFPGIRRAYGFALCCAIVLGAVFFLVSLLAPQHVMRLFTPDQPVIEAGAAYLRIVSVNYLVNSVGMIFATVLRSTEQVRLPLIASAAGVVIHIIFNYVLIFGKFGAPQLGLRGAAIASVISVFVTCGVLLAFSLRERNILISPPRAMLAFSNQFVRQYLFFSLPVFFNEFVWGVGKTVMMAIYGRMGTESVAALTAVRTVEGILFVFFVGLGTACGILVGKHLGEEDEKETMRVARHSRFWVLCVGIFFGLLLFLLRVPVARLFSLSPESFPIAVSLLGVVALNLPLGAYGFLMIVGIFRAGGDTRYCLAVETIGQWGLAITLSAVLGLWLKLPFVVTYAGAILVESIVKAIICSAHFPGRKWIRSISRSE